MQMPKRVGVCTFLHMHPIYVYVRVRVSLKRADQPGTHGPALPPPWPGWQRGETLSVAHPGVEGLPARLVVPFGPLCLWLPHSGPLGRTNVAGHLLF